MEKLKQKNKIFFLKNEGFKKTSCLQDLKKKFGIPKGVAQKSPCK
jgi:hypothetical protein